MDAQKQSEMLERLRTHLSNKTTHLSAYALQVPAEHYVDEAQLAQEVDALFKRRPLLVALTPHIPNKGDYLTHEVIDTSLLLVRDNSGAARAYINACRHRGARLAEGKGTKTSFLVPFTHGTGIWTAASLHVQTVTLDSPKRMLDTTTCLKYRALNRRG